jgi:DNA-binding NarL/FixJ family response regulator
MPEIRLLIVDDHAVVRKGLAMVLRLDPDFDVVGEAGNGAKALELVPTLQPDLVLLDRMMPEMDGYETAKQIKARYPHIKTLILTGTEPDQTILPILQSGVDGYVLKEIEPEELKHAIRTLAHGDAYLHPAVTRVLLEQLSSGGKSTPPPSPLTPREHEILQSMASNETYREIAKRLSISEETVKSHAKNILSKLNQPNRAQAVLEGLRQGWIENKIR